MDESCIFLYNINDISEDIINWILSLKEEYQIFEYNYDINIQIGKYKDKKIVLKVASIHPKPTIVYRICIENMDRKHYNNSKKFKDFLKDLVNKTRYVN